MGYFFNDEMGKNEMDNLFESVSTYQNSSDIADLKKDEYYDCVDKIENCIISKECFEMANSFRFGFSLVRKKDDCYYYLRKDGTFLNNEGYINADDFEFGLGRVRFKNGKYNYIKQNGKYLLSYNLNYAGKFVNNIALIKIGEAEHLFNYVRIDGTLLSPNEWFLDAHDFNCGVGVVKRIIDYGKRYYYLREDGKFFKK